MVFSELVRYFSKPKDPYWPRPTWWHVHGKMQRCEVLQVHGGRWIEKPTNSRSAPSGWVVSWCFFMSSKSLQQASFGGSRRGAWIFIQPLFFGNRIFEPHLLGKREVSTEWFEIAVDFGLRCVCVRTFPSSLFFQASPHPFWPLSCQCRWMVMWPKNTSYSVAQACIHGSSRHVPWHGFEWSLWREAIFHKCTNWGPVWGRWHMSDQKTRM